MDLIALTPPELATLCAMAAAVGLLIGVIACMGLFALLAYRAPDL